MQAQSWVHLAIHAWQISWHTRSSFAPVYKSTPGGSPFSSIDLSSQRAGSAAWIRTTSSDLRARKSAELFLDLVPWVIYCALHYSLLEEHATVLCGRIYVTEFLFFCIAIGKLRLVIVFREQNTPIHVVFPSFTFRKKSRHLFSRICSRPHHSNEDPHSYACPYCRAWHGW